MSSIINNLQGNVEKQTVSSDSVLESAIKAIDGGKLSVDECDCVIALLCAALFLNHKINSKTIVEFKNKYSAEVNHNAKLNKQITDLTAIVSQSAEKLLESEKQLKLLTIEKEKSRILLDKAALEQKFIVGGASGGALGPPVMLFTAAVSGSLYGYVKFVAYMEDRKSASERVALLDKVAELVKRDNRSIYEAKNSLKYYECKFMRI